MFMRGVPVAPHGHIFGQTQAHRLQEAYWPLPGPFSVPQRVPKSKINKIYVFFLKSSRNGALKQGLMRTSIRSYNARGGTGQAARSTSRCP